MKQKGKGDEMEKKYAKELADLRARIKVMEEKGVSYEQMLKMMDHIINGDFSDPNYKAPNRPLSEAKNKQQEADRILNNYATVLASLAADKKCGKDGEEKSMLKLSIIVGAASAGLNVLGFDRKYIDNALGLTSAANM